MIRDYMRKIFNKRAIQYVKNNFKQIDSSKLYATGIALRNSKCHYNSYEKYVNNADCKVLCVLIVSDDTCSVHFINYDDNLDEYQDVTLGLYGYGCFDYYIIGECILKRDIIEDMDAKLCEMKDYMIEKSFKSKIVVKFYKWLNNRDDLI